MSKIPENLNHKIDLIEKLVKQNSVLIESLKKDSPIMNSVNLSSMDSDEIISQELSQLKLTHHKKEVGLLKAIDELSKENLNLKNKLSSVNIDEASIKNYELQLSNLSNQLTNLKKAHKLEKDNLLTQNKDLLLKYDEGYEKSQIMKNKLNSKIDKLESDLLKSKNNFDKFELKLNKEKSHLVDQIAELTIKNNSMNDRVEILNMEIADIEETLHQVKKHSDKSQSRLIDENTNLVNELDQIKQKRQSLITELESLSHKTNILEIEIDKKNQLIKSLRDTKFKLVEEQQRLVRMSLKATDELNKKLIYNNKKVTSEKELLQEEISDLKSQLTTIDDKYELELSKKDLTYKKRVREMIESESRNEVMSNVKINELKEIIKKQKIIIDERDKLSSSILENFKTDLDKISTIKDELNYSSLDVNVDDDIDSE